MEGCAWMDVDICLRAEGQLLFIRTLLYDVFHPWWDSITLACSIFLASLCHVDRANTLKTSCLRKVGTNWLLIWRMRKTKAVVKIIRNLAKCMPIGIKIRSGLCDVSMALQFSCQCYLFTITEFSTLCDTSQILAHWLWTPSPVSTTRNVAKANSTVMPSWLSLQNTAVTRINKITHDGMVLVNRWRRWCICCACR